MEGSRPIKGILVYNNMAFPFLPLDPKYTQPGLILLSSMVLLPIHAIFLVFAIVLFLELLFQFGHDAIILA